MIASLRDEYEVSSPEMDMAVDATLAAGGKGARMTGAGTLAESDADGQRLVTVREAARVALWWVRPFSRVLVGLTRSKSLDTNVGQP
jgi:galactokinase